MHTSGYLGPNLLNEHSGISGQPLSPEELAAYEEIMGAGNPFERLHQTVLDLVLKHTVGTSNESAFESRPFCFDEAWWGVAEVNSRDFAIQGRKAHVRLQVWGNTDVLDENDYDDVFAHYGIHPAYTVEWAGTARDLQPEEARGLGLDALASFAKYKYTTD